MRAHVAYLAREARGQGQQPVLAADTPSEVDRSVDYLSRADVAGEAKFQFYDRAEFGVNPRAITASWADDPRHFRMIISAEDGEALGDLKPFIRETMAGLEAKLGTKLEWLAVDHHDTDNPHTHVLIRGRRPDGQELFIPSRLISSGIREHAQEIVTRALGPRVDLDLARQRMAEIDLRAPTGLDRELAVAARQGLIWPDRPELVSRLEHLERWDLADRPHGAWRVADGLIGKLKALSDADDLERAIASLRSGRPPQRLLEADRSSAMVGELLHVRVADDFGDRFLAIIETGQPSHHESRHREVPAAASSGAPFRVPRYRLCGVSRSGRAGIVAILSPACANKFFAIRSRFEDEGGLNFCHPPTDRWEDDHERCVPSFVARGFNCRATHNAGCEAPKTRPQHAAASRE